MKYLAHIPVEQYGFISVEIEGSAEDAVKAYKAVQKAHWNHSELNTREWCDLRNKYFASHKLDGDPGIIEKLSPFQRFWLNETKNAIKTNNK